MRGRLFMARPVFVLNKYFKSRSTCLSGDQLVFHVSLFSRTLCPACRGPRQPLKPCLESTLSPQPSAAEGNASSRVGFFEEPRKES